MRLKAAQETTRLVAVAKVQAGNAYLTGKGLAETSVLTLSTTKRISDTTYQPGDLIVPMTDFSGKMVNAQLINANGTKRILAGGQVKEAFYRLGEPGDTLWLTEGYATGLTVHRLTGQSVYVALSANNLPALA